MLTPRLLARIYDRCVAAQLRGDRVDLVDLADDPLAWGLRVRAVHAAAFADWLTRFWVPDGPPPPRGYPDAVSFLGRCRLERGPRWYAVDGAILGYFPGTPDGCYRIPADADLPGIAHLPGVSPACSEGSSL